MTHTLLPSRKHAFCLAQGGWQALSSNSPSESTSCQATCVPSEGGALHRAEPYKPTDYCSVVDYQQFLTKGACHFVLPVSHSYCGQPVECNENHVSELLPQYETSFYYEFGASTPNSLFQEEWYFREASIGGKLVVNFPWLPASNHCAHFNWGQWSMVRLCSPKVDRLWSQYIGMHLVGKSRWLHRAQLPLIPQIKVKHQWMSSQGKVPALCKNNWPPLGKPTSRKVFWDGPRKGFGWEAQCSWHQTKYPDVWHQASQTDIRPNLQTHRVTGWMTQELTSGKIMATTTDKTL